MFASPSNAADAIDDFGAPVPELTREARDAYLDAIVANEEARRSADVQQLDLHDRRLLIEEMLNLLSAYGDALPRVAMSVCPYCGDILRRTIDPFGFEGLWWDTDPRCPLDEPAACEHFRVLLGALSLNGRVPEEVLRTVTPGPDVPFVVPDLLRHSGMVAVTSELPLARGDTGYPIAYYSADPVPPVQLHQPWCREYFYFENESGSNSWSISNSEWDFELAPYLGSGQLRWTQLEDEGLSIREEGGGDIFPFTDLEGDRRPQTFGGGVRDLDDLPDGETINPYDQ